MDMLNSIHQKLSQYYGILNEEVPAGMPIWLFGLLGVLVALWILISLWFVGAPVAA